MRHEEYIECVKFHDWLQSRGIVHTHIANETNGDPKRGIQNKRIGVSSGFPDYIILLPLGVFGDKIPVAIEMKKPHGGVVSSNQKAWLAQLESVGFECAVCNGASEAVKFLRDLGYKEPPVEF